MNIERIRAQLAKIFGVDGETQWQQEKKKEDHPHGKPPGSGGSEAGERRVAGRRLPHPPFTSAQSLLLIILDNLRRANFRFIRVKPDVAQGTSLAQEVPALIQFDLDLGEPLPIGFGVRPLFVQSVLLCDKALNVIEDRLIFDLILHESPL